MKRTPAVAGVFYTDDPSALRSVVERYSHLDVSPRKAIAAIAPHAGYMFSGPVAGKVFASILIPETVVILCTNHTGLGAPLSIWPDGSWETPLGISEIDEELVAAIMRACPSVEPDYDAHMSEHSAEVELPFIQYHRPDVRIVVIAVGSRRYAEIQAFGEGLADAIKSTRPESLIVASTDMTHYEPDNVARKQDQKAIDRIVSLDPEGLFETVRRERITMCGISPTTATLLAAKKLGATECQVVAYATSGEVMQNFKEVVGYLGAVIR